jgi:hypothetical protein
MGTITTKDEIKTRALHRRIGTAAPRSGNGKDLFGLLVALGAGIAFGLVLAVCFVEGERASSGSARTLVPGFSLSEQNAAPEDESVRRLHAAVSDTELGSVTREIGDQLWPDPNTD